MDFILREISRLENAYMNIHILSDRSASFVSDCDIMKLTQLARTITSERLLPQLN